MKKINATPLSVSVLLSVVVLLSSCGAAGNKKLVLRHMVAFQFKEEVSENRREQAVSDFLALKDLIPEIKKFEGGDQVSAGGLDKGFSHCFILTFESEEARDIYMPHPAHMEVVNKNKPLLNDLLVMEYWGVE
ncbi:MAG: Dabb family protein [Bacteroidota bacterium]